MVRITLKDALAGRRDDPKRTFVVLPDGGRFRVDQLTPEQLDTTLGTIVDLDAEEMPDAWAPSAGTA